MSLSSPGAGYAGWLTHKGCYWEQLLSIAGTRVWKFKQLLHPLKHKNVYVIQLNPFARNKLSYGLWNWISTFPNTSLICQCLFWAPLVRIFKGQQNIKKKKKKTTRSTCGTKMVIVEPSPGCSWPTHGKCRQVWITKYIGVDQDLSGGKNKNPVCLW